MPKSKTQSSSDDATDSREIRRRVVKACQRCRLKKCKCDGATPCTRCKSDDAICAYGKHKKSDKIMFRKGYVQMLERQHIQLIAGLQELYRRTQRGEGWTGPPLDCVNYGQPLTHKILEALGVLHTDEWDDSLGLGDGSAWQSFEQQGRAGNGMMCDTASDESSPVTSATLSPTSTTQPAFPFSTIMAKRRSKYGNASSPRTSQTLMMPSMTAPQALSASDMPLSLDLSFCKPEISSMNYDQNLSLRIPPPQNLPMPMFNAASDSNLIKWDENNLSLGNLDWMNSMTVADDMFDPTSIQNLPLQVQ